MMCTLCILCMIFNNNVAMFFENKDLFYKKDFEKQYSNITENLFSDDVNELLCPYNITAIKWGIGIPETKYSSNVCKYEYMIDFLYTVDEDGNVYVKKN